mmetsp:Transcript_127911/g.239231  ORF Transcript_127911/g.239231 Transcript_127911/m.239231 type:complete len:185 (+) Transcript_127911:116-670(+)
MGQTAMCQEEGCGGRCNEFDPTSDTIKVDLSKIRVTPVQGDNELSSAQCRVEAEPPEEVSCEREIWSELSQSQINDEVAAWNQRREAARKAQRLACPHEPLSETPAGDVKVDFAASAADPLVSGSAAEPASQDFEEGTTRQPCWPWRRAGRARRGKSVPSRSITKLGKIRPWRKKVDTCRAPLN